MKSLDRVLLLLLCSSLLNAQDNMFYEQHKINKSYIKSRAINQSKRGNKNATFIKIKNKKELKEAIKSGKLHKTYKDKGDKNIYIEIKNIHLSKKEAKELDGVIGSTIKSKGRVKQVISMDKVTIDSDKPITIGVDAKSTDINSMTSVTTIKNSQIGGD